MGTEALLSLSGSQAAFDVSGLPDATFFCSACGSENHHLARFCRSCRADVSFDVAFDRHVRTNGAMKADAAFKDKPARIIDFKASGARAIRSVRRFYGYLVVATQNGGLHLLSAVDPRASTQVSVPGFEHEDVFAVATPPGRDPRRELLVATRRGVARVTLLPGLEVNWIHQNESPDHISVGAYVNDGVLIFSRNDQATDVYFRRGDSIIMPKRIQGFVAPDVLSLEDGRVFFHTRQTAFLCDAENFDIQQFACPFGLDLQGRAFEVDGRIFVPAEDNMGVFQQVSGDFWKLPVELMEPFAYHVDSNQNEMYVSDSEGLKVVNAASGALKWDSTMAIGAPLTAGLCAPLPTADGAILAGSTPMGQNRLVKIRPYISQNNQTVLLDQLPGVPKATTIVATGVAIAIDVPGNNPHPELVIAELA